MVNSSLFVFGRDYGYKVSFSRLLLLLLASNNCKLNWRKIKLKQF